MSSLTRTLRTYLRSKQCNWLLSLTRCTPSASHQWMLRSQQHWGKTQRSCFIEEAAVRDFSWTTQSWHRLRLSRKLPTSPSWASHRSPTCHARHPFQSQKRPRLLIQFQWWCRRYQTRTVSKMTEQARCPRPISSALKGPQSSTICISRRCWGRSRWFSAKKSEPLRWKNGSDCRTSQHLVESTPLAQPTKSFSTKLKKRVRSAWLCEEVIEIQRWQVRWTITQQIIETWSLHQWICNHTMKLSQFIGTRAFHYQPHIAPILILRT